jgi:hypothetical protein
MASDELHDVELIGDCHRELSDVTQPVLDRCEQRCRSCPPTNLVIMAHFDAAPVPKLPYPRPVRGRLTRSASACHSPVRVGSDSPCCFRALSAKPANSMSAWVTPAQFRCA